MAKVHEGTCENCGGPRASKRAHARFCSDACRAAFHEAQRAPGIAGGRVASVRALKHGRTSVVLHFPAEARHRLAEFDPGDLTRLVNEGNG